MFVYNYKHQVDIELQILDKRNNNYLFLKAESGYKYIEMIYPYLLDIFPISPNKTLDAVKSTNAVAGQIL